MLKNTETPKFIMGGVAPNFIEWANGPGAGQGRNWDKPKGKYRGAQFSPWVLWPADGLNLKQGACGELFGYGYLPLPLTPAKSTTAGKDIPTGENCWKKPGPVAGPFHARPGDGSVVTYYWYRFADQPASLNADLTDQEREALQARVEKIHRNWKKDRDYLPPPTLGKLADIDPALIVTPPPGLEAGYVPIATRQAAKE